MSEEKNMINNDNNSGEENSSYSEYIPISLDIKEEKSKKISLKAFIISMVALFLVTVMFTFTFVQAFYRGRFGSLLSGGLLNGAEEQTQFDELELLDLLFQNYSYYDLDEEQLITAVLKAYADATGDEYAEYYTAEEYEMLTENSVGNTEGIGITVIQTQVEWGARSYQSIKIVSVIPGGPADEAGLRAGDIIFCVGHEFVAEATVDAIGYDKAMAMLQGEAGTNAEFITLRPDGNGGYIQMAPYTIARRKVEIKTVTGRVCETDSSVGIVKITQFNLKTPVQFKEEVDSLVSQNCEKFVFDVRYNGGGDLRSIVAVLSYFLNEGDTIISTSDNKGNGTVTKVQVVNNNEGDTAACNVSKEDIGRYRDLRAVVLCNESTASAAELFVANFRDYKLAKIVGNTTYGKGSMQSVFSLAYFGYSGAVKLTTNMYFPPSGVSYDGVGIEPDVKVALSAEAAGTNIYELHDADDNQLQEAIKTFQ